MPRTQLAPRKAPRQGRSAATVSAILGAAARILETRGLEGYNTNAVAERAGVSIGSLYQYFPGKDALTAALIREEDRRLIGALDRAVEATEAATLDETLAALAGVAVRHQFARPGLARLLDAEEARLPMSADDSDKGAAIRARIEVVLARHRGDLGSVEPRIAALDLLSIARGLTDGAARSDPAEVAGLEARLRAAVGGYLRERGGLGPRG